ncbi:MAG: hypothetical protein R6V53_06065 [Candidatus Woesearchaeota archaeon]
MDNKNDMDEMDGMNDMDGAFEDDAREVTIIGKQLECNFCGNNTFYEVDVKLNTTATTFFSGVWSLLAENAKAYICSKCGKKQEFA